MPIQMIQRGSFDPETTRLLGTAYDRACESVPLDIKVREVLAKRLISAANWGERDLETLIEYALGKVGLTQAG
jgi:hypothetical protein